MSVEHKYLLPAESFDTIVIGGGLAGLSAAYNACKHGERVVLIEERGRVGGLVCSGQIGGVKIDIGAESFARRAPIIGKICEELGLKTVQPQGSSWVWDHSKGGRAVPIPVGTLGIPADLDDASFAPGLVELAGEQALQRARQDLEMPAQVGAQAKDLATLVRERLGEDVLRVFVEPVAGGIHSARACDLDVDTVIPGLRQALAQTGSLSKAAALLRKNAPSGSPVAQPEGGMYRLVEALEKAIVQNGGQIRPRVRASHIELRVGEEKTPSGQPHDLWRIYCRHTKSNPQGPGAAPLDFADPFVLSAQRLVIATPGANALKLLQSLVASAWRQQYHARYEGLDDRTGIAEAHLEKIEELSQIDLPSGAPIGHVTLVLDTPELDDNPRGSGMLVAPPSIADTQALGAKALTHYSAKWPDTLRIDPADEAAANLSHLHVLRVSYGRPGQDPGEMSVQRALADASRIFGRDLSTAQILGSRIIRWDGSLPPHTPKLREQLEALNAALREIPGLDVTGAWLAGSGIAAVMTHAFALPLGAKPNNSVAGN